MNRMHLVAGLSLFSSVCSLAAAQTVTVEVIPMGLTALDMSPDGRWVVGGADQDGNGLQDGTYRYDTVTGTTLILPGPGTDATAVSDDGSVILGNMPDPNDGVQVAAIWTEVGGWQSLGWLPDSLNCPSRSSGYELSGDGTIATGLSWDGCSGRGFRWTQATGMVELEPLANGSNRCSVMSADGSVMGGFAQGSFSRTPAMWDGTTTDGMLLDPPDGDVVGEVQGISDDGTVLLGNWAGDAYMWTESGGVEILGAGSIIPTWNGIACDIADDGTIIGFDTFLQSRLAWIKPAGSPDLIRLNNFVLDNGGTIPSGVGLAIATRCSADGSKVIGHAFFQGAWIVNIEGNPCPADLDGDTSVGFGDLVQLLAAWGPCPGCDADLDDDDEVGFGDLVQLLAAWGPCP